ncbi:sugar ABC transporter substrate-binding protein [Actinomadura opuntiae]|uniref:sugar ABC transporter substrate-binding protein n=1 Tax=Actinomadura sp. OS1-43 TaxID=604315 RepID=UPI00255AF241|nr:substrate-binding domain-containing protein [Actinomadura sp. OS1-43]MDL4818589.1 substrate-binding domain-containing protein [Actinomadura sp. OS1-43]
MIGARPDQVGSRHGRRPSRSAATAARLRPPHRASRGNRMKSMLHPRSSNTRRAPGRARWAAAAAAAALTAAGLSACGESDASGGAGHGATSAAGLQHAKTAVENHKNVQGTFKAPGEKIAGLGKFKGRTIAYVPITLKATYFQAELEQITQAAAPLGMKVQVCDAQAQPTAATQCLNQAVASGSAGIITDSLPFALARNAYAAAAKAGVPVVASDVSDPIPQQWANKVVTTDNGQDVGGRLMADAIIADSGGKAKVLFVNTTSTSTTKKSSDAVLEEFKTYCPGCKVTTAAWEASAVQKIPTTVSVALNADPSIDYVYVSYDQPASPPALQGMQLSGRANKLKVVGYGSDVAAMQRIANGKQLADVAVDPALVAWNNTDHLLRMLSGAQRPEESAYTIPRRVFNKSNIHSVNGGSVKDFKDGAWFTDGSFRKTYAQLWGVG